MFIHGQFYQNRAQPSLITGKDHWSWVRVPTMLLSGNENLGLSLCFSGPQLIQSGSKSLPSGSDSLGSKLDGGDIFLLPTALLELLFTWVGAHFLVYNNLVFLPGCSLCCCLWGSLSSFLASRGPFGLVEEDVLCLCCRFCSWDLFLPPTPP